MAEENKFIEKQIKHLLWSPEQSSSAGKREGEKNKGTRGFRGKYKRTRKQNDLQEDGRSPSPSVPRTPNKDQSNGTKRNNTGTRNDYRGHSKNDRKDVSDFETEKTVGQRSHLKPSANVARNRANTEIEDVGQPVERPVGKSKERDTESNDANQDKGSAQEIKKNQIAKKKKKNIKKKSKNSSDILLQQMSTSGIKIEELLEKLPNKSDPDLNSEVQAMLEAECVFILKKKSPKFPLAKYYCRLCDYHCDNIAIGQKHVKDTRHKRLSLMRASDIMLKSLPGPSQNHIDVVTELITNLHSTHALSSADINKRNDVVTHIRDVISKKFPDVVLTMYGSSSTGFGLNDCDLNVDLAVDKPATILSEIYILLKGDKSGFFQDVRSDFSSKVPSVLFKTPDLGDTVVQVGINSSSSCKVSKLLATYSKIDTRLSILATIFRYWAKLVKIDKQENGTLPAYTFYLMTVYYLQQCSPPVLPVLHQLQHPYAEGPKQCKDGYFDRIQHLSDVWTCDNQKKVGELWIGLLKFYTVNFDVAHHIISIRQQLPMHRNEKKWTSKRISVEDPFMKKRNVAKSVSHPFVHEYIDERLRAAYLYFGNPQTKDGPLFTQADINELRNKLQIDLKHKHQLSQCSTPREIPNQDSKSPVHIDCIEKNITGATDQSETTNANSEHIMFTESNSPSTSTPITSAQSSSMFDKFVEQFGNTVLNSAVSTAKHQLESSCQGKENNLEPLVKFNFADLSELNSSADESSEQKKDRTNSSSASRETCTVDSTCQEQITQDESDDELSVKSNDGSAKIESKSSMIDTHNEGINDLYDESKIHNLKKEDLIFTFAEEALFDGKGPAVMCQICQKEGHLKRACPEEKFPPLPRIPPMTAEYEELLTQMLWNVPKDFKPTSQQLKRQGEVLKELENYIGEFYPGAKLEAFGSSRNGFGFKDSDLDICLTFAGKDPKDMDFIAIIEDLAKILKRRKGLYDVVPITSAKVPIVKFKHRAYQVEGDISLYNTLAIHNTRMLSMYSQIDRRVEGLGYIMKVFAKICEIGDASRGSLSSYTYIILVLYFLQQRDPPVVPVLQEFYDGEKPVVEVDGWNAWYYSSPKKLPRIWSGWGRNTESLGQLWVGLLKFYADEFNFKDYVICIRQHKPLTKFEKLWNGKGLAIEDPFDLNHQLGGGLSRKMSTFILKAFRNGCLLHSTQVDSLPHGYRTLLDYLFDPVLLTDSTPPNDRGCRGCGKIGHYARNCPFLLKKKERQMKERQEKLELKQQQQHQQQQQQQHQQQMIDMMDDREYWRQQDMVANRHRKGSTDRIGAIPIPEGHRSRHYQRTHSQGSPNMSSSPGFHAGSPRAGGGYQNGSPTTCYLTWQQEQFIQSLRQHHQPSSQYHGYHSIPSPSSSPSSTYYQQVMTGSPSRHPGRPSGSSMQAFPPQYAVETRGLPSQPVARVSSYQSHGGNGGSIAHSDPIQRTLEVTTPGTEEAKQKAADSKRRNKRKKQKQKFADNT